MLEKSPLIVQMNLISGGYTKSHTPLEFTFLCFEGELSRIKRKTGLFLRLLISILFSDLTYVRSNEFSVIFAVEGKILIKGYLAVVAHQLHFHAK